MCAFGLLDTPTQYGHHGPMSTQKVLRKGKITQVANKDLQRGDIQFGMVETERSISAKEAPLPGTRRVEVMAIGPFTRFALKFQGQMMRVPEWVVMSDGRALKFHRLFKNDGTADVEPGEFIFPGGAVFQPCPKTDTMERAERESRTMLAAARLGIVAPPQSTVLQ